VTSSWSFILQLKPTSLYSTSEFDRSYFWC